MTDQRRKTQVPIRKVPEPVEWILKNSTFQQLQYLNSIARSSDFSVFVNLVGKFKEFNVYEVYRYRTTSPEDLAYFRAAKVGEVAGLDALIMACQGAQDEINRRRKLREVK